MPLLLTLAIIVVVLVVLVLLYLTFVPIVALFRATACLTVAELAWGIIGLRFRLEPGIDQRLDLLLLGRPVRRLPLPKREAQAPEVPGEAPPAEAPARSVNETIGHFLELVGFVLRIRPDVQRLLIAVVHETRLRLRLGLVFGTGDAPTTGETFGALMAVRGILSAQPWLSLNATPVFDGPVFDWDANGEASVRSPIRVMVPALRLFLRPEVRALVRRARS
ncbi:MAG: DUF2953 domain-containing protein [Methanospirillum sp.]